ncbi:hypothetical protein T12_14070 [Trichinella patagoniensis]|uniref:Uncharacterized protein n=1 Tax=Trichinella patagoniensis TaxID=990121 RepID=A0A0V0ZR47_9BILA|nr:hypothetical protein T12_14070 [Trichinella patagoniensis]
MRYRQERRHCYCTVIRNHADEDERNVFVTLSSVETEKELKHSCQVVSRWKAIYNETPVEFIPGEGKTRQSNKAKLSVTPGSISLVSVRQTELQQITANEQ